MAKDEKKEKPVRNFRIGTVWCSVWKRDVETDDGDRTFFNTTFSRAFKRKDSEDWEYTQDFSHEDLLKVKELAGYAFAWILRQQSEEK